MWEIVGGREWEDLRSRVSHLVTLREKRGMTITKRLRVGRDQSS